ncbi:MAG: TonB-dependent receptor, partial [Rhodospirillales bacterium]|nr:TonB-dependent receptor [Acetobacter sp.]
MNISFVPAASGRRFSRHGKQILSLCAVVLLLVGSPFLPGLRAQQLSATLTGTITDPSGAAVAGATLTIHSNATGNDLPTVTADNGGHYSVTNLPPGTYNITVKQPGFETYSAPNVVLNVAQVRTLDAKLTTGQVNQTITVQESSTPVETSTAEQAGTITGTQVRELELNNRNFQQLVLLQPGVSATLPDQIGFGLSNSTSISVNGARANANNWTVDGADINDSGSNGTLLNVPSIDAIQEFTLERSTYDAAYGRSGGGQVLVATKSGTNEYHGDAYEFVRNDFFNANNELLNAQGADRPVERYNDFGFTVGGPLMIPKVYNRNRNKTFFFWSEEWRKESTPAETTVNTPTAQELAGTFPGAIPVAPAGCVTAAGGTSTINPACYSRNATAYLNNIFSVYPGANGGNTLAVGTSQLNNFRQDLVRGDENFTDKLHFYVRLIQDTIPQNMPFGLFSSTNYPGVANTALSVPGKNAVGNLTYTITPKIVNELEYAYSFGGIDANATGTANDPAFASQLTGITAYPDPYGRTPALTFASGAITGPTSASSPYFERNIDQNVFDNLSIILGNHTLRTGYSAMFMRKTENGPVGPAAFTFNNANGDPEFANFLLGQAFNYTQQSQDTIPNLHYTSQEAYIQDDWKVSSKFTLNLGLRWSFFPTPTDVNNTLNNFVPSLYNPALAPTIVTNASGAGAFAPGAVNAGNYVNGLIFPNGTACNNAKALNSAAVCSPYGSLVNPNRYNNLGPRIGFAWDPIGDGKTAIRGGYGMFYDRPANGLWEQNAFTNPPRVQTATIFNNTTETLNLFDDPLGGAAGAPTGPGHLIASGDPQFKASYYQDFNFSIQREIFKGSRLEVAYVGTLGRHLVGDFNLNQPTLATRQANPTAPEQALVPYPGYDVILTRDPVFNSNYNSLQVTFNRQMSHNLSVGLAYTWSKFLTNNFEERGFSPQNSYDFANSYGPSQLNTPHVFTANFVYNLPGLSSNNRLIHYALGGWEVSGIV